MNNEFSPFSENAATKFRPVDLNAVETSRMFTKFQVLKQEAKDKIAVDAKFKNQAERLEVIETQFSEIQRQALNVLFAHNIPVDENTTIGDYERGLDNVKELVKGLGIALEHGQWQPNVWRKEIGDDRYRLGFELLRAEVKAREGITAADHKSRLLTQIGNRGLGASSGENIERKRETIAALCKDIDSLSSDPNVTWRVLAEKGVIPNQLLDDTEGMINMMQIYKICDEIEFSGVSSQNKKLLKAHALVPYIDKGVNAVFIDEVIEGKYDFDDRFFQSVVEGLAGIKSVAVGMGEVEYSRKKEAQSKKKDAEWFQRDIREMLVTSVVAWTILTGNYAFTSQKIRPEAIPAAAGDLVSRAVDLPGQAGSIVQETIKSLQQNMAKPPDQEKPIEDYSKIPSRNNEDNRPKKEGDNHKVATNVDANDFLKLSKIVDWEVEGYNNGYFKQGTASKYDYQTHKWKDNIDPNPLVFIVKSDHTDTVLKKTIRVSGRNNEVMIDLPVLYDEFVNTGNIVITSASGGQSVTGFNTEVLFNNDGSYRMVVKGLGGSLRAGDRISLRVGLTKFDRSNPPDHLKAYLYSAYVSGPSNADTEFVFDRNYLPDEVKEVIRSIKNNKELNDKQKTQVLSEWFRRTFTYSLDTRWEKFYEEADSPANYFQRILTNKKVTCEGANTALAIVARSMGLPAREVYGYMNNGMPIFPIPAQLTGNKAHAWVEVYVQDKTTGKGEWIQFDGTPTKLDPTSLRALAQLLEQGQQGLELPRLDDLLNISLDRLSDEALLYLATLGEFGRQHTLEVIFGTDAVIGAAYLAGLTAVTKMRRSLEKKYYAQREIFRERITQAATTPNMISNTFFSHAERMFGKFSKRYRVDRDEYGGFVSGMTQVFNPKLLWRLHRSPKVLAEQAKAIESMPEIKHYEDLPDAVAKATGTDIATVERSMVYSNSDMIRRELSSRVKRCLEEQIYGSRVHITGIGDDYYWKMRIYLERTLENTSSFEEYYDKVTRELFRYRRIYLQKLAKLPPDDERRALDKRTGSSFDIPPDSIEALVEFRKSIERDFARPAWVMWKYAKKEV